MLPWGTSIKKLLLAATAISALAAGPAYADLFPAGTTFVAITVNAPATGTFADLVTLGTTNVLVSDLENEVTSTVVTVDANTQWLVFHYVTSGLGETFSHWAINETNILASVGVDLVARYIAFDDQGANLPMTTSIFGPDYVPATNPLPGGVGDPFASNGLLRTGFSTPFPGGFIDNLPGTVLDPFGLLSTTGIDSTLATGYTEALEFTAQFPVTGVPEPAMVLTFGAATAGLGLIRRRHKDRPRS